MTTSNYQAAQKLAARLARLEQQLEKVQGKYVIVGHNGKLKTRVFGSMESMRKLVPSIGTNSHYEIDSFCYVIPAVDFMAAEIKKCKEAISFFK